MKRNTYYVCIIIVLVGVIICQNNTIDNWKSAASRWEKIAKGWEEEARKLSEAIDKHISQH